MVYCTEINALFTLIRLFSLLTSDWAIQLAHDVDTKDCSKMFEAIKWQFLPRDAL